MISTSETNTLYPKLYRSVIEDVIEGVRDLFAEEGIEEQVLKDLKLDAASKLVLFWSSEQILIWWWFYIRVMFLR
uniref:Uncharacterized protein n=1 Tax=Ursus americanus TaxID=9643 RepID=A0A452R9R1_URSAM